MTTALLPYQVIPGLRRLPAAGWRGNMLPFLYDPIGHMHRMHVNHGPVVAFDKGRAEWILAVGADFNQQLLGNTELFWPGALPFPVPDGSALQRLRFNLTSMRGEKHRQQRRLVMPAFHKKRIETYWEDMVSITGRMLDSWSAYSGSGRPRDMAVEMQKLASRIAIKTLFGLADSEEAAAFTKLIEAWMRYSASIMVTLAPIDRFGTPYHTFLDISARLEAAFRGMIERKRAGGPANTDDVLSMLLHANDEDGSSLTEGELIGQTYILLVAGYETTARALTWTLFLLSQHPQIAADLLDELAPLGGEPPAAEQMRELPLLDRVIKESLRILPPVYITTRSSSQTFALGQYELPAGTNVVFSHYLTHHLPELFSQPNRFWPDRWLSSEPTPYEYIPFSAGARLCIGSSFATMEMKVALAMLLQRYRVTLPPNAKVNRSARATLGPQGGLPMLIVPQDRRYDRVAVRGNIREMVDLD